MIALNKEEICRYGALPVAFIYFIGAWVLLAAPLCGFLGALSGSSGQSKVWRRSGIPVVLCGLLWAIHGQPAFILSGLIMVGLLSLGYGTPSEYPHDDGSVVGRFAWSIAIRFGDSRPENEMISQILSHGIITAGIVAALFPVVWISFPMAVLAEISALVLVGLAVLKVEGNVTL